MVEIYFGGLDSLLFMNNNPDHPHSGEQKSESYRPSVMTRGESCLMVLYRAGGCRVEPFNSIFNKMLHDAGTLKKGLH